MQDDLHICMERTLSQDTIHTSYASSNVQAILKDIFPPVRKHPTKLNLVGIGNLLTGDEVRHILLGKLRGVHITPLMAKISPAAVPAKKAKNTIHMRTPIFVSRPQTAQVRRVRMPSEINMLKKAVTVKHSQHVIRRLRGDNVLILAVYCFRQVSGAVLGTERTTKLV